MDNQQRYIDIDGHQVPVTEEVYRAYKRPLWAEHKRQEREKRCRVENGSRCTGDCSHCTKERTGAALSLEQLAETGYEAPDSIDIEELVADKMFLEQLYTALDELTPEERELIDDLFTRGKTERAVASKLGLSQKAINKRRQRTIEKLRGLMNRK